jgi:hypothetical protein
VLIAAKSLGWPPYRGAGVEIAAGEENWRAARTEDLVAVWEEGWHGDDLEGDYRARGQA